MSSKSLPAPEGWDHVLVGADLLDALVDDIFRLPEAADERAKEALAAVGDDHGDDLVCGCWGAHTLASSLLQLLGRHIDACLVLVRTHAAYATPVMTLARAVVEHGVKVAWLLGDEDVHVRERRFYEFEREERRLHVALGKFSKEEFNAWDSGLKDFLAEMPGEPEAGQPSIETLCEEYGRTGGLYRAYRMFSQQVHGTSFGAGSFHVETRDALDELGLGSSEWLDSEFVSFPFLAMWEAAETAMEPYGHLLAPDYEPVSLEHWDDLKAELAKIPPNAGWLAEQAERTDLRLGAQRPKPNRAARRRQAKLARRRAQG